MLVKASSFEDTFAPPIIAPKGLSADSIVFWLYSISLFSRKPAATVCMNSVTAKFDECPLCAAAKASLIKISACFA
jgi:hypothetical protein